MAMVAPETCYIHLLDEDILAKIFSCLPEQTSIAQSALTCKPWCHIITDHGILRQHRPPALCGIFQQVFSQESGKHCMTFSPTDQVASPDLAVKNNNIQVNIAKSLPGGPWSIIDSMENLLLLWHVRPISDPRAKHVFAIYNPVTHGLKELPPMVHSEHGKFFGAAMLRDAKTVATDLSFKVVCVVAMPGDQDDKWTYQTWVHSGGSGDGNSWSVLPYRASNRRTQEWYIHSNRGRQAARTDVALFHKILYTRRAPASYPDSMGFLMLDMRSGGTSLVVTPPRSWMMLDGGAFVDYGRGNDEKLWFICIDRLLVLRLYSHPKPGESSTTHLSEQSCLEREVELHPLIMELVVDTPRSDGEQRACKVRSRNGYVFFSLDKYGYFAVHLRNMRVQRLSGVSGEHMDRVYPIMCREDA
uniref:F-box domain-containing protein n=1 Tax=Hordeum vulgare subsp. vulgare TaxID=112509 RepID=A0A8I6X3A2_HORVV